MHKRVLIIQRRLTSYRVPFFERLRDDLRSHDIELSVAYGISTEAEIMRQDEGVLPWGTPLPSRYFNLGNISLLWQSIPKSLVFRQDLIILSHESSLLANYIILSYKFFRNRPLIAFWGHGKNFQKENSTWLKDAWKRRLISAPDWWFGYTQLTKDILLKAGFPGNRITIVQNSIDTQEIRKHADKVGENDLADLRRALGLQGRHVGVFCGSLYRGKRLDLILKTSIHIRKKIDDFELLIIGSGPEEKVVLNASAIHDWIRYVGKRTDYEKVLYMKLGHVLLLPHIVGLAILDSFACGLPLVTMDNGSHSPEIAYLRHTVNGLMCENCVDLYAGQIINLLKDPGRMIAMAHACKDDAQLYTIQNMVTHFSRGIQECLGMRL